MGISIDESRVVYYDGASHDLIDSRIAENPVVQRVSGMEVYSVFRRVKLTTDNLDGNPLIHALKSAKGYSIDCKNILAFMPEFRGVMSKVAQVCRADHVMPVPSKSSVAAMFARRVSRHTGSEFENSMLQKKINKDIYDDLKVLLQSGSVRKKDQRALDLVKKAIQKSLVATFELKQVDQALRHYFTPFKIKPSGIPPAGSVLLVDDLLSTGTSLLNAKGLLAQHGVTDVKFLCLFSALGRHEKVVPAPSNQVSSVSEIHLAAEA